MSTLGSLRVSIFSSAVRLARRFLGAAFPFVSALAPLPVSIFSSAVRLARRFLGAGAAFPSCRP